jgi:hypothetical protein
MFNAIVARIKFLLSQYGEPSPESMRWARVFEFMAPYQGIDTSTKGGRKDFKAMKAEDFDYSKLNEQQLLDLYELVVRRWNTPM